MFFCKYNDPIYVKLEKLEIMVALARAGTRTAVLAELKEYAQVRSPARACWKRACDWHAASIPTHRMF